jgi:hypothetical protein
MRRPPFRRRVAEGLIWGIGAHNSDRTPWIEGNRDLWGLSGRILIHFKLSSWMHSVRYVAAVSNLPIMIVAIVLAVIRHRMSYLIPIPVILVLISLLAAVEYRSASRLQSLWASRSQLIVERVLAGAPIRFSVFLRPFGLDGKLVPQAARWVRPDPLADDLEVQLAYALEDEAPVVSISGPADEIFGTGRASLGDREWRDVERRILSAATMILVVPGSAPSIVWEASEIIRLRLLDKCVFIMPQHNPPAMSEEEWSRTAEAMSALGLMVPPYFRDGMFFTFPADGSPGLVLTGVSWSRRRLRRILRTLNGALHS